MAKPERSLAAMEGCPKSPDEWPHAQHFFVTGYVYERYQGEPILPRGTVACAWCGKVDYDAD